MTEKLMRLTKLCLCFLLIVLFGSGCNPSHQQENDEELLSMREQETPVKGSENQLQGKQLTLPLEAEEAQFHSVADWKDDKTIFYILNDSDGSKVYTYNIYSGDSILFFTSEAPIVQLEANEDNSLLLIHTSPSSYEAELIIVDSEAKVQYQTTIESYELQYTWNQQSQHQLFVSSFNEDWTYNTYIIDTKEQTLVENPVDIPFIQWINDHEVSYLKWDQEAPALTAPLYIYNLDSKEETSVSDGVVANTNYTNIMSTIEIVDEDGTATVRFYDSTSQQQLSEMLTRLVALYSDWSIPYHDMDNNNHFYMLEVNKEKTGFSLISFSLDSGEKQTVIEKMENLPIKLSPNGDYALYGARYEHLINLDSQKMLELISLKQEG